jgi:signal transduction histidine kinase/DNA-binding NarL/FixJ family response regulator
VTDLRLLIVEDDDADADLVVEILDGRTPVERASSIAEARSKLAASPFDVALLDLALPDAFDLDGLSALQASAPRLAIVILSGHRNDELVARALRSGAQDFLIKGTFDADLLLRILRYATERQVKEWALRDQTAKLETLNRIGQMLAAELDMDRLVRTVTDAAREISGACFAAWFEEDGDGALRATFGIEARDAALSLRLPPGTPFLSEVLRRKETVRHDDLTAEHLSMDDRLARIPFREQLGAPMRCCLSVPVVSLRGLVLGGIFLADVRRGAFDEGVERAVRSLAAQTAVALDNARLLTDKERERLRAEQGERRYRDLADQLESAVRVRTRELEEANERLKTLDRLKNEFLATVSHELRTPLNAIIGFTTLLLEGISGPLSREQCAHLHYVHSAGEHLLDLINDLLDLSRIEAGVLSVSPTAVDLRDVVCELVESMRPAAREKNVELRASGFDGIASFITDPKRFRQIVVNLVGNAVKFTDAGHVEVRGEMADGSLIIRVVDTGIGIDERDFPLLFQPFQRIDGAPGVATQGAGLGLYLSRKLASVLGGDIHVESRPGEGSCFTVTLPSLLLEGEGHLVRGG